MNHCVLNHETYGTGNTKCSTGYVTGQRLRGRNLQKLKKTAHFKVQEAGASRLEELTEPYRRQISQQ